MHDLLSIYAPRNRAVLLSIATSLVVVIAAADFATKPYFSLGFLYLFPIMIVGGFLPRTQTVAVALVCAVLQEVFSDLPRNEAVAGLLFSAAAFSGAGLLIFELVRNRQMVLRHIAELEAQERLRKSAEEELHFLVNSSPAAIFTIDGDGHIALCNQAAEQLLGAESETLHGQSIARFLPALHAIIQTHSSRDLRTTLQCRGQRLNGEAFLAGIWFSTYTALSGTRLAAIVVDLSEDLRSREDLGLDQLLKNTRILMSAVAHEVRNLCSAALVVHQNLSQMRELQRNEDFQALSTLIQSLETIMALELQSPAAETTRVDLTSAFDEVRVVIEAAYTELQMEIEWLLPDSLPIVRAERYGLIQVFLNLARNSQRAMQDTPTKRLTVSVSEDAQTVTVRFEDTGVGVESPERLFHPFQPGAISTGLGLYVSRAIVRSYGGDLIYEERARGACFAIVLGIAPAGVHG